MDTHSDIQERTGIVSWIFRHPKTTLAISLLILVIVAAYGLHVWSERELTRRIAAIRAKGEPTTIEEMNARRQKMPDDQNMYVQMAQCVQSIKQKNIPKQSLEKLPWVGDGRWPRPGRRLDKERLKAAQWYLGQVNEELKKVHTALRLGRGDASVTWTSPAANMTLPPIVDLRDAQNALFLELAVAWNSTDSGECEELLLKMLAMSNLLSDESCLLTCLVQQSINLQIEECVERTINAHGLRDEALSLIQSSMADFEVRPNLKRGMLAERVYFIDTLKQIFSVRGFVASGAHTPKGYYQRVLTTFDAGECLELYNAMVEASGMQGASAVKHLQAVDARSTSTTWYGFGSGFIVPAVSDQLRKSLNYVPKTRALCVAVACERFRLAESRWPSTASDLIPRFMTSIPLDPFDDRPIRFKPMDDGIVIWSVGMDQQDDGGQIGRLDKLSSNREDTDDGWVLLNPELRGREGETPVPTTQPSRSAPRPSSEPSQN